ncbi:MAG: DUF350 domain-containing protein [Alphaproteobacteria bacterium]|nr:DUF350 domain-containing protein [Alphaproteobacteria bacterium]
MDIQFFDGRVATMLVMDFAIIFAVLLSVRFLYGLVVGVSATHELAQKDNFAFGISLTGATAGVAIMLSGVATGGFAGSFGGEALNMVVFSLVGLALMWLTRLIFDLIALPGLSIKDEIAKGNAAVAVVDAGNLIATAVMVRAIIIWADDALGAGLAAVVGGYVASQIILTLTAYYRVQVYRVRNAGNAFQAAIQGGNLALALRFIGFQIGVAFAVTAASSLAVYDAIANPIVQAAFWGLVSLVLAVALAVLGLVAERCVLAGVNVSEEVDRQQNVGVATTEVAVYIAIGLLMGGLLG